MTNLNEVREIAQAVVEDGFSMLDHDRAWRESVDARLDRILELLQPVVKPKRSNQRKAVEYSVEFEQVWGWYPKRSGGNSKVKAYMAWEKSRGDKRGGIELAGHDRLVLDGVKQYHVWCKATDKIGTEYVFQAATFLGPGRHWESDWSLPEPKAKKVPSELNALVKFAKKHGIKHPSGKVGEPPHEFRARVVREVAGEDS